MESKTQNQIFQAFSNAISNKETNLQVKTTSKVKNL